MGLVICDACKVGYFDSRYSGCPNPKCKAYVKPEGLSKPSVTTPQTPPRPQPSPTPKVVDEVPKPSPTLVSTRPSGTDRGTSQPPKQDGGPKLTIATTPLASRLGLPEMPKPVISLIRGKPRTPLPKKEETIGPNKTYTPRPYGKSFKLSSTVVGFEDVNATTTREQRTALAESERKYAAERSDDPKAVWSVKPILDADVGPARGRAAKAMEDLKRRNETLEDKKSKLSEEDKKLFDKLLQKRMAYKLFEMSGTATRPGNLGQPGRDAIVKAVNTVAEIDPDKEPHDAIFLKLNKAMAVNDSATGATVDQFGKRRTKAVALPVLKPSEPRADGMPPEVVGENLEALNDYISTKLKDTDVNPIELIAKQYMMDVTVHPCIDANGRSALLSTFPLAQKFGLPWPLVTKTGSEVFHCQAGQANDTDALHPADVMAYIAEGMSNNLKLQEQLLEGLKSQATCSAEQCSELAWANVEHGKCKTSKPFCDLHLPKSLCPNCGDIGIKTAYI